jgi:hypothetical protein
MNSHRRLASRTLPLAAAILGAALGACGDASTNSLTGGGPHGGPGPADAGDTDGAVTDPGGPPAAPFEAVGPATYVPKVKNLMTGLPATDAEVNAVVADPNALRGLIDQWMALPQFQGRMLDFFRNAFQQNQVVLGSLMANLGLNFQVNPAIQKQLERNIMDSFPLTVWEMVKAGQALTTAVTTNQYMMTTAMMSLLSYADDLNVDDKGKLTNRPNLRTAIPATGFTIDPTSTATLAQSLDPTSPSYMIWHLPATFTGCTTLTPYVINTPANMYQQLFGFLLGRAAYPPCVPTGNQQTFTSQFADADFSDWRMVTLNPTDVAVPSTSPIFYDVLKLRAASAMSLHTQRIGFFGTLAFDANWGTNSGNEARVTANQTLIVATGASILGEDTIVKFPVNATDADHASNPACAVCHNQLDPFKQYFRQSYSLTYHDQTDTSQLTQPAGFNIGGVTATGQGVGDLSRTLAGHPRFKLAWAEKLFFWGTSTPALEDDPELIRIADAFAAASYDFKTLAREVFSSPLLTLAGPTKTTQSNGVILSIARRDQFCAALSNRMGLPDVCGMETVKPTGAQTTIASRALLMPVDTYYRSYALPSYPTNPDLFFRDSVESVCRLVADQVVDVAAGSKYNSKDVDAAVTDFVATVMGLPTSDPRSAPAAAILKDNYTAALATKATPTDSLKSTFTLACIAPSSIAMGL